MINFIAATTAQNDALLLSLIIVLIIFAVLGVVLLAVFVIALRKRPPVVKVVQAPPKDEEADKDDDDIVADAATEVEEPVEEVPEEVAAAIENSEESEDSDESSVYVTEGAKNVRYSKSFIAKLAQCKDDTKEWYTVIKNELLSYTNVNPKMSWKRESFTYGRMVAARLTVRGKTLCLMLAVEPESYDNTKYTVEDVSNVASNTGTPTLYRIKSDRRLKYAKEMIAGFMQALNVAKNPNYHADDFYVPYDGTVGLIKRGLIKRIVANASQKLEVQDAEKGHEASEETLAAIDDRKAGDALVDESVYVTEDSERLRYDKSFVAKIAQSTDELKEWYTAIKNELLSYKNVRSRQSWKRESFSVGKSAVVRFVFRGKTFCMLLAAPAEKFAGTKYAIEDISDVSANDGTPSMLRIKSERRVKYAKEIIGILMSDLGVEKDPEYKPDDFYIPFEGTVDLMKRGLIKRTVSDTKRTYALKEVDGDDEDEPEKE